MADVDKGTAPGVIGGRYETVRLIGRGGMGSVWLAQDRLLGRRVAIKQIVALPGEAERETDRAMREARTAAALNHPNVVALYDAIVHEGRPWLVMEYVAGPTLSAWVREHGVLDPEVVAEVGARLADGLAASHRAGIVHRDIKPANVFMAEDGEPKIGDFGTARGGVDDQLTLAGVVTGTPSFMAPEVADGGDHTEAADVWALGATLYFAVEGTDAYPATGNALVTLRNIATRPPRPPERAGALEPVLARMLAHDPSRREGMVDVMHRLRAVADGRAGEVPALGAAAWGRTPAEDEETNAHFVGPEGPEPTARFAARVGDEERGASDGSGAPDRPPGGSGSRRRHLVAGLAAAVLIGGAVLGALTLGDDREGGAGPPASTPTSTTGTTDPGRSTPETSSEVVPAPETTTELAPGPGTEETSSEPPSTEGTSTTEPSESGSESRTESGTESGTTSPSSTPDEPSSESTSEPGTETTSEPPPTTSEPAPEPTSPAPSTSESETPQEELSSPTGGAG